MASHAGIYRRPQDIAVAIIIHIHKKDDRLTKPVRDGGLCPLDVQTHFGHSEVANLALQDKAFNLLVAASRRVGIPLRTFDINTFSIDSDEARRRYPAHPGSLKEMFLSHNGRTVHKWLHYLDIYEKHFAAFRNTPIRMLEIGVNKGGSLELWRKYFGENATIFGIDIDPDCASRVTPPNQVRIGSQADPHFLRSVVNEMGTPDIVLDDGSHFASHQRISFDTLFPLLRDGGLYLVEDLHTSYFYGPFEGGYRRKGTAIERVKDMIDDMHGWYHRKATTTPAKDQIAAIHIYDSIAVIEKRKVGQPCVTKVGS